MDLRKMLGSKEYKDARARIQGWSERLEKGGRDEAAAVRDEKAGFFGNMKKGNPSLYVAFQIDDKSLSEAIFRKLTGTDAVFD